MSFLSRSFPATLQELLGFARVLTQVVSLVFPRHQGATMLCNECHMSRADSIRRALYHDDTPSKRERRAAHTRAQALAPGRILMSLITLPVLAFGVAMSIYIRTSDYDPPDALAHLVARGGCDAARYVGLAPAFRGGLGYHLRNDADGDGVACEAAGIGAGPVRNAAFSAAVPKQKSTARIVSGAKFVMP